MNPECQAWPALQSTSRGRPPPFEVSRFEFLLSTTNAALPAAWRQWFSARRSRPVLGRWQTFRVGERRRPAERPLPARNGYRRRMEAPASRQGSLLEVSATGAGRLPGRVAGARTLVTPAAPRRPGPGAGALDAVKAVPPRGPRGAWTRGRTLPLLRIVFAGVTESTRETPGGWRSISCCSAARCIAARRPVEVSTRYRGPPCFASNVRPLSSMQPRFLQR